ncbi:MAG: hypothetical protein ACI9XK_004508 [Granulosicoccus sp.]|jgi:hypothetical protein
MKDKADAIHNYILAKDSNRPFLLDDAFTENATLKMIVRTDSIAFPASSVGRDAIAEVFVRQFNQKYENIHTICVGVRPEINVEKFSCSWVVVMSEKETGLLRVGCGRYDWEFCLSTNLVQALAITIDYMGTETLPSLKPAMLWMSGLPYPWCDVSVVAKEPPKIPAVMRVVEQLHR